MCYISTSALMLDIIKLISWLDWIEGVRARFYGFTYTLSWCGCIVLLSSICYYNKIGHGKSNLYTLDLQVLYL